jgi:hypothetical protein
MSELKLGFLTWKVCLASATARMLAWVAMELLTERRCGAFRGRGGASCGMRAESSAVDAEAAASGLTAGAAAFLVGEMAEPDEKKSVVAAVFSRARGLFGIDGVTGMLGTAGDRESKEAGGGEYREPKVVDRLRGLAEGERRGFWASAGSGPVSVSASASARAKTKGGLGRAEEAVEGRGGSRLRRLAAEEELAALWGREEEEAFLSAAERKKEAATGGEEGRARAGSGGRWMLRWRRRL